MGLSGPEALRDAILEYREHVRVHPDDVSRREHLGRLYLAAGLQEEGARELLTVARGLTGRGEFPRAIRIAREVMTLGPAQTDSALLLAEIYARAPQTAAQMSVAAVVADEPLDASTLVPVREAEEIGAVALGTEPPRPLDAELFSDELVALRGSVTLDGRRPPSVVRDVPRPRTLAEVDEGPVLGDPPVDAPPLELPLAGPLARLPKPLAQAVARRSSLLELKSGGFIDAAPGEVLVVAFGTGKAVDSAGAALLSLRPGDALPIDVRCDRFVALGTARVCVLASRDVLRVRRVSPPFDRALSDAAEILEVGRLLAAAPAFSALPAPARSHLARRAALVVLQPGERLLMAGDPVDGVWLLLSGELSGPAPAGPAPATETVTALTTTHLAWIGS